MNAWSRCKTRTEQMCKHYNISCEVSQGNGRMGVSYSLTFYIGNVHLHELRDRSPSVLYDKLAAFDWGLQSMKTIQRERSE